MAKSAKFCFSFVKKEQVYKLIIFSLFLFLNYSSKAQIFKVPDLVKQVFDRQYPEAKEVDWNGGIDNHTVSFKRNEKKFKASYTGDGSWNYTETKVVFDSLPKTVQQNFKDSKYKEWVVKDCIEIVKPRAEANEYKIIVQKSALNKKVLIFDTKGRLYEELTSF